MILDYFLRKIDIHDSMDNWCRRCFQKKRAKMGTWQRAFLSRKGSNYGGVYYMIRYNLGPMKGKGYPGLPSTGETCEGYAPRGAASDWGGWSSVHRSLKALDPRKNRWTIYKLFYFLWGSIDWWWGMSTVVFWCFYCPFRIFTTSMEIERKL